MFEKVNYKHPDKLADCIAGAIVDLAYKKQKNPKIAVEVLLGHGCCHIIAETTVLFFKSEIEKIVKRITEDFDIEVDFKQYNQDENLSKNQEDKVRCGDNGIFKGVPVTKEQRKLVKFAKFVTKHYPYDGKYIIDGLKLIVCQSHAKNEELRKLTRNFPGLVSINPLGEWTGGSYVDTGCTNRKLGSDMGDSISGGGLHGKDLSKADVSVNIYAFLKAQETGKPVELSCAIGDETVDGIPYEHIVKIARDYIDSIGGFEEFAKWGLVR